MSMRGVRAALIDASVYLDPINRERDRYLADLIDLDEFERRVERLVAGLPAVESRPPDWLLCWAGDLDAARAGLDAG